MTKLMGAIGKISVSLLLIITSTVTISAKDWRGITPLVSTRANVEQLLGAPPTDRGDMIFYQFEKERVSFRFSDGTCGVGSGGWKVARDVVVSIWVTPKPFTLRLAELKLDESKYKMVRNDHVLHIVEHVDEEEGVSYQVDTSADGMVALVKYFPAAKDNSLSCPPTHEALYKTVKADEYSDIPFGIEKSRLDRFAERLRRHSHNDPRYADTDVYIMAYAGRRARPGEARTRAKRAQDYLIKVHRLDYRRIVLIDGGHREEPSVELYLVPPGGTPPIAAPTVDPREVQIEGTARGRRVKS